eukprot:5278574-Pyramimonas_sp.AAC.1
MHVPYLALQMDWIPGTSSVYAFEEAARVSASDIAGCVDLVGTVPARYVPGPRGALENDCPEYS